MGQRVRDTLCGSGMVYCAANTIPRSTVMVMRCRWWARGLTAPGYHHGTRGRDYCVIRNPHKVSRTLGQREIRGGIEYPVIRRYEHGIAGSRSACMRWFLPRMVSRNFDIVVGI